MSARDAIQGAVFLALLIALVRPLGGFMARPPGGESLADVLRQR